MRTQFLSCLLAASALLATSRTQAQILKCGTSHAISKEKKAWLNHGALTANLAAKPTSVIDVKVQFHVVCSGPTTASAPVTLAQINNALAFVNTKFAPAQLNFTHCGSIDYIFDSPLYNTFTRSEIHQMQIGKYDKTHCINIYYFHNIEYGSIDGFTYIPSSVTYAYINDYSHTRINLATDDAHGPVNLANVMAHEMGHFFGLYHTNGDQAPGYTDELVNGTNSTTNGDFIGDTPADPAIDLYHSPNGSPCVYPTGSPNCSSSPSFCDINSQIYTPLADNIMYPSPFDCNINFTQGQIDVIYDTYDKIFKNDLTGREDLVSSDNEWDAGHEPYVGTNYIGQLPNLDIWQSPDIWNCRTTGTCASDDHQSAGYLTPNKNTLRVKVTNRGCATSTAAQMHAYWTLGSTGELWSSAWINKTLCGDLAGDEIPNLPVTNPATYGKTIPSLATGASTTIDFDWYPIDPTNKFTCITGGLSKYSDGNPMICLLSRIVSANDPMFNEQTGKIGPNVGKNNNIVTRNTSLVKMSAHKLSPGNGGTVLVESAASSAAAHSIRIKDISNSPGLFFDISGQVIMWLSDELWTAWTYGEQQISGGKIYDAKEHLVAFSSPDGALNNVTLQPGVAYKVAFTFYVDDLTVNSDSRDHSFMLYQTAGEETLPDAASACIFKVHVDDAEADDDGDMGSMHGSNKFSGNSGNAIAGNNGRSVLFPNPVTNTVNLQLDLAADGPVDILLVDINGRTVGHLATERQFTKGIHTEQFNLAKYADGIYFMKIKSATMDESIRFVIHKK